MCVWLSFNVPTYHTWRNVTHVRGTARVARGLTFSQAIQPRPTGSSEPRSFFNFTRCGSSFLSLSLSVLLLPLFVWIPFVVLSKTHSSFFLSLPFTSHNGGGGFRTCREFLLILPMYVRTLNRGTWNSIQVPYVLLLRRTRHIVSYSFFLWRRVWMSFTYINFSTCIILLQRF